MAEEVLRDLRIITIQKDPEEDLDSVRRSKCFGDRRAFDILFEAQSHWNNMDAYRKERRRNKRYYFGKQWSDVIIGDDGKPIVEEQYIRENGNIPLKNNLIRRFGRNLVGVYEEQDKVPTCTARDPEEQVYAETFNQLLKYNMDLNRMNELYPRSFEEYIIGGLVAHRKWYGWRGNKLDCWTDSVPLDKFFIDTYSRDVRGLDCSIVGQIHDLYFGKLIERFAHGPEDVKKLSEIYSSSAARNREYVTTFYQEFGMEQRYNPDFLLPDDPNRCRVVEVWKKEIKPRYHCHDRNTGEMFKCEIEDYDELVVKVNEERVRRGLENGMSIDNIPTILAEWAMDEYWYYYYLSPFGDILEEGESPYSHGEHPFVFKAYPFLDGEIHSMVADLIDQQRYINRLIMMYDWIMRASAKGVLLFPEECLPDGYDIEDIADEWHRYNGVIAIKTKNGTQLPQQIANNSTNIGISELLNIEMKFFDDIGINGALQGKPMYSGMSGTLYAQQAQNAATSLLDILNSFAAFVRDASYKDVKNMQQFYDTKRVVSIAGKSGAAVYDPETMQDIEVDLSVEESLASPAYKDKADQFLLQIWQTGQISLEQLLENGNFPYKDRLLQSLKTQGEQIKNGQVPEGFPPELIQQIQSGADMSKVNQAYNMLKQNGQA